MKFVIADCNLINQMGHSYEYDKSVSDYARALGYDVTVVGNSSVLKEIVNEIGAIPHFRFGIDWQFGFPVPVLSKLKPVKLIWNYWHHTRAFYSDLSTLAEKICIDRNTVFIFHTIRHFQLLSLAEWIENFSPEKMPYFVIVLRFTTFSPDHRPKYMTIFYRKALRKLEKNKIQGKILIFTDSEFVAGEYRLLTRLPIRIIPIPHTGSGRLIPVKSTYPVRITYLGPARSNKGFYLLPYVFEKLCPQIESGEIEVEVQANIPEPRQRLVKLTVERLRKMKIKLYETILTNQEYRNLLNRSGIILLPYILDDYHSQTSGIFSEALCLGKPVIVPKDTWMANQLETYGAGLIFSPGDPQSLYRAVQQAIENCEKLTLLARDRAALWNKKHTPGEFLRIIAEAVNEK